MANGNLTVIKMPYDSTEKRKEKSFKLGGTANLLRPNIWTKFCFFYKEYMEELI